jgi:hypothetical protein
MKALSCRGWRVALLVALSGCAGELEDADSYTVRVAARGGSGGAAAGGRGGSGPALPSAGRPAANGGGAGSSGGAGGAGVGGARAGGSGGGMAIASDDRDAGAGTEQACDFPGLMQAKCGSSGCHGGPGAATGLDLTTPMLAMRAAGRMGSGSCTDKLVVDKDDPRESKLFLKVSGTTCGSQMPVGGAPLNLDEQACVLSWIEKL